MYNLSNGFLNVFHSTPDLDNGLRFNVIYEFNHIRIMLYNTSCLSQFFDSSNANTIRDIANNIKRRMWIYCKVILIRVVCL